MTAMWLFLVATGKCSCLFIVTIFVIHSKFSRNNEFNLTNLLNTCVVAVVTTIEAVPSLMNPSPFTWLSEKEKMILKYLPKELRTAFENQLHDNNYPPIEEDVIFWCVKP